MPGRDGVPGNFMCFTLCVCIYVYISIDVYICLYVCVVCLVASSVPSAGWPDPAENARQVDIITRIYIYIYIYIWLTDRLMICTYVIYTVARSWRYAVKTR
jgi:hypothetical protein